jgi:putative membrane protein
VPSEPVDGGGVEPDYRFSLANERTFLAWVRTSLALLAGGIALEEVGPASLGDTTRRTLAVVAVALSLMLAGSSYVRWHQVQQAMRHGRPLPRPWAIPVLSTAMVAVAGAVAMVLALR